MKCTSEKGTNQKVKVVVVLPAFNAEKTLERTYQDIPKEFVDDIILVDDASTDNTVAVARRLNLTVIQHDRNLGYGANQKTCYIAALAAGADIVVMVHPDYQYDPTLIPQLIEPIKRDEADAVLGSRMMCYRDALRGGMPIYKFLGNIVLTWLENIVLRQKLSEYHTGYRAYSRRLLESVPFQSNSDTFVFDTEIIVQLLVAGFKIAEVPVPTRYFPGASSADLRQSILYGFSILWRLAFYLLWRVTGKQAWFKIVREDKKA